MSSDQRKLHVLEVNKAYYPHIGGIESVVRQVASGMAARDDMDVRVLVCVEKGKGKTDTVDGVPVEYAGSLGTVASCPISFDFFKRFRRLAKWADVIEFHMPFPLGDVACLLSGYKGAVVLAWHSDVVRQKTLLKFYAPILRRFLKRADRVIVATKGHITSSPFLSTMPEKCTIIPYGLDVDAYRAVPPAPILHSQLHDAQHVCVLFVGRFVYYKGVEVLLQAMARVHGAELFLVGHGTEEMEAHLHQMVEETDQVNRVHFMGNLEETQLRQAFSDCDIFVLPSVANSEAFGIVQMEAMVYGKPVINTSLPTGVPYVSLHGKTGLTVPPEDEEALAQAIQTLTDDPALRKKYGDAGARRTETEFALENVMAKTADVLRETAERRQA